VIARRVEAYGLTARTSAPSFASTFGMTNAGRAERVVDDHLEGALGHRGHVHGAGQGGGVELDGPGREADVADVAGEDPPVVLAVEEALDLALRALGDVDAELVEEADHDRLRVVVDQAHRDPALAPLRADLEPRGRDRASPRGRRRRCPWR
jgi:hypothetical protein